MPGNDLSLLTGVAAEGGRIAMSFWGRAPRMWDKPGGAGPVSEADMAVDTFLRETLLAARPGHGWLSEETADGPDRLNREAVFIVDPIDGTRAFLDGGRDFALSLALVRAGRVIAAVVHMPARHLTFTAEATGPALCNGAPIAASPATRAEGATLLTARQSLDPVHWKSGTPPVRREFRSSLAYRLCLVAAGDFDAMLTLRPAWEWDVAAGALIAERAGAVVSDAAGRAVAYNAPHPQTPGLVAAPSGLHADLVTRLRPIPARVA